MHDDLNYKNNPLHSVGLKKMLTELSDHYGFEILFAYLNINCFNNNPSIASSVKFLKKTDWAREKVEGFYLYSYKNLPKASRDQYQLPPRDRIVPDDQTPGEPAELSLEDAARLREKRELKSAEYESNSGGSSASKGTSAGAGDNHHANQNSRRSNSRDHKNASNDNRSSLASSKRTASTAQNPWGKPKT